MMTSPPVPPMAGLFGPWVSCSIFTGSDGFDFGAPSPMMATIMAATPAIMAAITVGVFQDFSAGGLSPGGCLVDVTRARLAMSRALLSQEAIATPMWRVRSYQKVVDTRQYRRM